MNNISAIPSRARKSSIFSIEHRADDVGQSTVSCNINDQNFSFLPQAQKKHYENTYKMEPDKRFNVKKAKERVDAILADHFSDQYYDPLTAGIQCKNVSQIINAEMKSLDFPRFKYVCSVTIGQNENQGIKMASRYLWDARRDNWFQSELSYKNVFVVATVFALYFE
eukprot:gene8256-9138_t